MLSRAVARRPTSRSLRTSAANLRGGPRRRGARAGFLDWVVESNEASNRRRVLSRFRLRTVRDDRSTDGTCSVGAGRSRKRRVPCTEVRRWLLRCWRGGWRCSSRTPCGEIGLRSTWEWPLATRTWREKEHRPANSLIPSRWERAEPFVSVSWP